MLLPVVDDVMRFGDLVVEFVTPVLPQLSEAARASFVTSWIEPGLAERALGPFVKVSPDDLRRFGILPLAPKDYRP